MSGQHEQCLLNEAGITASSYGNKVHDADSEQYKNTRGQFVVGWGTVCTWSFSLNWAASVGWLKRSMVPVPSWMMAPRGTS